MRSGKHVAVVGLSLLAVVPVLWAGQANHLPGRIETILDGAEELELLSLEPGFLPTPPRRAFHGWKVLGSFRIREAGARREVVTEIRRGVAESDGAIALCFNPRHGVRARSPEGVVDLVICFECFQIEVRIDGQRVDVAATTASPQPFLDGILRNAKVPLARR